jgi:hypothetical protein
MDAMQTAAVTAEQQANMSFAAPVPVPVPQQRDPLDWTAEMELALYQAICQQGLRPVGIYFE